MKSLVYVGIGVILSTTWLSQRDSGAEEKSLHQEETAFAAAHCHGFTAKTEWTLGEANAPTPACVEGKSVNIGVLDFDADEVQSAIVPFTLPGQFKGKLHVTIRWQPASTIGSVGWCVELVNAYHLKRGGGASLANIARDCTSEPTKKSDQHLTTALIINAATTGPAADNDVWHLRVTRDANSSVVLDDMPGNARLIGIVIATQEAPRQKL